MSSLRRCTNYEVAEATARQHEGAPRLMPVKAETSTVHRQKSGLALSVLSANVLAEGGLNHRAATSLAAGIS
jgi:hypothetical protein